MEAAVNGKYINMVPLDDLRLTPSERKIAEVLADGQAHEKHDLFKLTTDRFNGMTSMQYHITGIRRKLRFHSQDIISVYDQGLTYYRWVIYTP